MLEQPETRYARTGDVHIAYQVVGDGPIDIVLFGTFVSHVELIWDDPQAADLLRRLASFSRLIIFDKRGVGMSDPMPPNAPPTLEERLEDVRAVMDAAGSQEAVLLANSEGGQLAVLFATIYPERTRSIVFFGAFAALRRRDDYPIGVPAHVLDRTIEFIGEHHGETGYLDLVLPSVADDQRREAWWAGFFRRSTSPGAAATQVRMNRDADVRHLLPLVQVPALVLHAEGDRWIRPEMGRYLAENIPEARFVSLPGGRPPAVRGARPARRGRGAGVHHRIASAGRAGRGAGHRAVHRHLVGSTERAAVEGDHDWTNLVQSHDRDVRRQIERYGGRRTRSTGDGFFALFDGPARAIRCAVAIHGAVRAHGLAVRIGLHTGEVELRGDDVTGIAVHIGARVSAEADAGEVLVSGAIPPLIVGSGIELEDRGHQGLKGVPGEWQILAVTSV